MADRKLLCPYKMQGWLASGRSLQASAIVTTGGESTTVPDVECDLVRCMLFVVTQRDGAGRVTAGACAVAVTPQATTHLATSIDRLLAATISPTTQIDVPPPTTTTRKPE